MKLSSILVGLLLPAIGLAQTCTFTSFGRPCGGDLAGQQIRTPGSTAVGVEIGLTNAAPGSYAVLVLGQQARPMALPGSNCELLVAPRATVVTQVGPRGAVTWTLRIPARVVPLSIDLQAVTIGLNRNGRIAESSNGLTMACR